MADRSWQGGVSRSHRKIPAGSIIPLDVKTTVLFNILMNVFQDFNVATASVARSLNNVRLDHIIILSAKADFCLHYGNNAVALLGGNRSHIFALETSIAHRTSEEIIVRPGAISLPPHRFYKEISVHVNIRSCGRYNVPFIMHDGLPSSIRMEQS